MKRRLFLYVVIFIFNICSSISNASESTESIHELGNQLSILWVIPFVLMLLAIAILPLVFENFWEKNKNKFIISIILGMPVFLLYFFQSKEALIHTGKEYVSFIILLTSLFVISSGILLKGDLKATPLVNCGFLALGGILASFTGTTGASLLLIRPLLQTNRERKYKVHTIIFFIFIVANIGGLLTPLGDPPLFMGYLRGVPFVWTFRLIKEWAFVVGILLILYFVIDSILYTKEPIASLELDKLRAEKLRLLGIYNFLFLAGIVLSVAFLQAPVREIVMLVCMAISFAITPKEIYKGNEFSTYPIVEVAVLFFGIFLTMIPALDILYARGHELGVQKPYQFFWATGTLSSFLDNTPTYVTFFSLAQGLHLQNEIVGMPTKILEAISMGAVFMGANTYIGNAPNFMVRSIAAQSGVKMPSFFGYMLWSIGILIPIFILVTFIFL